MLDDYVREAEAALRAAGHEPGGAAATLRRLVYHGLGRRPLRRMPHALVAPLRATGLLHAAPTIVWRDGTWHMIADYAV